jgi:hypothetical protein
VLGYVWVRIRLGQVIVLLFRLVLGLWIVQRLRLWFCWWFRAGSNPRLRSRVRSVVKCRTVFRIGLNTGLGL